MKKEKQEEEAIDAEIKNDKKENGKNNMEKIKKEQDLSEKKKIIEMSTLSNLIVQMNKVIDSIP